MQPTVEIGKPSYSVLEVAREFSILALLTVLLLGETINPEFPNFAIAQQYYTTSQVGKPVGLMASAKLIGWQPLNEESEGDQTDEPSFFYFFLSLYVAKVPLLHPVKLEL